VRRLSGLALAEGCYGTALVLFAGPLLRTITGEPADRLQLNVTRVLGTRQLLQGVATTRRPTRRTLRLGAAVDVLHAATMLAGAATNVGPRRLTLASAATAVAFAVAGVADGRRRR
jgi:hypothetical protein